jgi:hypothetical protein
MREFNTLGHRAHALGPSGRTNTPRTLLVADGRVCAGGASD